MGTYEFWIDFGGINVVDQSCFSRRQLYLLVGEVLAVVFRHINFADGSIEGFFGVLCQQKDEVLFPAIGRPVPGQGVETLSEVLLNEMNQNKLKLSSVKVEY